MNRCCYCLCEHDRRAACCSPEHTAKMRAHRRAVTAGRNRARARLLARAQARVRHVPTWRRAAMGQLELGAAVAAVFGVREIPPMRDPTL